jgi:cell division septation protein DedD
MVLIKRSANAALVLFLLTGVMGGRLALYAQTSGAALLADEIPLLERRIGNPGLPAAELHDCLVRLGRLFLLSGNLEGAAGAFNRAAFANPEDRDDRSLLEAVRCYLALGEKEKAESGIQMVLVSGRDPAQVREARFLGGLSYAFSSGNTQVLASLLGVAGETGTISADPSLLPPAEQTERKSVILYTLWKITGNESYRTRLRTEYPLSPEAKGLDEDPRRQIAGASSAMWMLFPGRDAVSLEAPVIREPVRATDPPPAVIEAVTGSAVTGTAAQAAPKPEGAPAASGVVLQTGLFGREENAGVMAERLRKAGFAPVVSRRAMNGQAYFVVSVNASSGDVNAMILRLKDSGFEAFPVY